MADFHTKYVDRGNGRSLWLFSESARDYELLDSLPAVPCADAHMRWHPLLREWVCHAGARQGRTCALGIKRPSHWRLRAIQA